MVKMNKMNNPFYPRVFAQMTQVEFANACGVSRTIIFNIEHGIPVSKRNWTKVLEKSLEILKKEQSLKKDLLTPKIKE